MERVVFCLRRNGVFLDGFRSFAGSRFCHLQRDDDRSFYTFRPGVLTITGWGEAEREAAGTVGTVRMLGSGPLRTFSRARAHSTETTTRLGRV